MNEEREIPCAKERIGGKGSLSFLLPLVSEFSLLVLLF
jgi:hypothetical protein